MLQVEPGDVIFSYVNQRIVAVSIAKSKPEEADQPDFDRRLWQTSGWRVSVAYALLSEPLAVKPMAANLVSDEKFQDLELFLEFMLAKGSNSGIYLHGLYEVQIFDSFGYTGHLTVGDCGAIYGRDGNEGGSPPLRNAARAPGEWQSLHVWFRAPRFDSAGKKVTNARFLRVLLNDVLVQESFEAGAPTQAHVEIPEAAENPLMLQGDHGPIAYRNIYVRPLADK
jgi:hypothetical protein